MSWFRRNVRRFTAAESFRFFMEGVRELHHYDKEFIEDPPDEDLLNGHLAKAEGFFRKCTDTYPDDLLPRYYLGIVLTMKAQAEQARELMGILRDEAEDPDSISPDDLLLLAAKHFETIADRVDGGKGGEDLLDYSQYNRAQALAKTLPVQKAEPAKGIQPAIDEHLHWDTALRILQKLYPRLVMTKLSRGQRIEGWFRYRLDRLGFSSAFDLWLNQLRRDSSDVSAGVAVPLEEKLPADRAFEVQVRVLEYAIQLRKAVHGSSKPELNSLPTDEKSEKTMAMKASQSVTGSSSSDGAAATVRDLIARIQEDTIRSDAQSEIVADYWNKLAFIAWERATLDPKQIDTDWLERAREYINIARKGRANWTPGQLNLARIQAAEGNKADAKQTLEKVLGKKKDAKPSPPPPQPAPDSDAIAGVILKMAVERNPKAMAAHIQRCYGALSQETNRKVTEALAGKIDGGLLNDILSAVPVKTEAVPQ